MRTSAWHISGGAAVATAPVRGTAAVGSDRKRALRRSNSLRASLRCVTRTWGPRSQACASSQPTFCNVRTGCEHPAAVATHCALACRALLISKHRCVCPSLFLSHMSVRTWCVSLSQKVMFLFPPVCLYLCVSVSRCCQGPPPLTSHPHMFTMSHTASSPGPHAGDSQAADRAPMRSALDHFELGACGTYCAGAHQGVRALPLSLTRSRSLCS